MHPGNKPVNLSQNCHHICRFAETQELALKWSGRRKQSARRTVILASVSMHAFILDNDFHNIYLELITQHQTSESGT